MILFDTSVIIDARDKNSPWHGWASRQLAVALSTEGAAVNPIILAETCVKSIHPEDTAQKLETMGIQILDLPASAAILAAKAYSVYLERRKGESQSPAKIPLPDFFIGAHAQKAGFKLATRDLGRFKTYFPKVELVVP